MATGIVSIAAADHGYHVISDCWLCWRPQAWRYWLWWPCPPGAVHHWTFPTSDVSIRLFTFVAACAVLGARLADHRPLLWVLGATALAAWLLLSPLVAHRMWWHRWTGLRDRAHGAWELASVATSGLAIVSADLGLLPVAVGFWVLAICVYVSDVVVDSVAGRARSVGARGFRAGQLDSDGRRGDRDAGRRPHSPRRRRRCRVM